CRHQNRRHGARARLIERRHVYGFRRERDENAAAHWEWIRKSGWREWYEPIAASADDMVRTHLCRKERAEDGHPFRGNRSVQNSRGPVAATIAFLNRFSRFFSRARSLPGSSFHLR